jgi:phosphatidylglycerol:prolipoprotein diacylglycerol transferase
MHKILVSEPLIGSYSACLLLALLGGYLLARWRAVRSGIKGSHLDNLALLLCVFSLFGARFFSWLFYFPTGISLWSALRDSSGGMVFYGGLLFGALTVLAYARVARLPLGNLLDALAPGVALGLAIGRIGCFMAGCCWGDLCVAPEKLSHLPSQTSTWQLRTVPIISQPGFPFALSFPTGAGAFEQHRKLGLLDETALRSLPVHPVQLYEAGLCFLLCVWLLRKFESRAWQGDIACRMLIGYAAIRFMTEFLRADNPPAYLGLTLSQVISLVLAFIALAYPGIAIKMARASNPGLFVPEASSTTRVKVAP